MKYINICIVIAVLCFSCSRTERDIDYTQYINGFIGNADNGHTFPGATSPFGLVQASPESGVGSWRYCSGYNYDDDHIIGFSQTHLSGTGVPDLGDILLLPFIGTPSEFKSSYDRRSHQSTAGYYHVNLSDFNIDVELTATAHTAVHRYTYNEGSKGLLLLDLQHGLVDPIEKLKERVLSADIELLNDSTIIGSQKVEAWVERQYHYVIRFDKPYKVQEELVLEEAEKGKRLILSFDLDDRKVLNTKIAISSVSVDGALRSLEMESPNWDFEQTKAKVQKEWNTLLSRVEMEGTETEKVNFYTSMYHLFIQPNNIADIDGQYRGADDKVYTAKGGKYYSTFSLWDTYRAAHPLYTILTPELVDGFVETMLAHHDAYGYLPIWTLWGKENYCMIGNHSIPVIVDAYLKGFDGYNIEEAYQAIKETSMTSHKNSDWEVYNKYGYYPYDIVKVESVSRTLESSYDDYCVAQMAKALDQNEDYEYFIKRSQFYKNVLDPETKLMRGKDSKGNWRTPFDSFTHSHAHTHGGDYTEGNAWQYTWHVQHAPEDLVALMGGEKEFINKLDSLFYLESKVDEEVADITGLIGQYAHGNEPSHHVSYLYSFVNRQDKTQELIREIFDRFYLTKPDGLCGNDDCGQMSAWYIFSAMGFYPVNPVGGEYILGAPQMPYFKLHLPNGKEFVIEALNSSKENKYVESVSLNGKAVGGLSIHHKDIMNGGRLVFIMTNKPNKS